MQKTDDIKKVKNSKKISELFKLFLAFFKIGLFTIGGGLVMIPIMKDEFVNKRKWVDDDKILDIFAISQALPGVIAINSSIYIGYTLHGFFGAIVAAMGIILPSYLCILIIYFALLGFTDNVYLNNFYLGVRSAIVPLIGLAALKLGKNAVKDIFRLFVALVSIALTIFLKLDVAFIIVISAFSAYIYYVVFSFDKQIVNK